MSVDIQARIARADQGNERAQMKPPTTSQKITFYGMAAITFCGLVLGCMWPLAVGQYRFAAIGLAATISFAFVTWRYWQHMHDRGPFVQIGWKLFAHKDVAIAVKNDSRRIINQSAEIFRAAYKKDMTIAVAWDVTLRATVTFVPGEKFRPPKLSYDVVGYYDPNEEEIRIAWNCKDPARALAHEYAHVYESVYNGLDGDLAHPNIEARGL